MKTELPRQIRDGWGLVKVRRVSRAELEGALAEYIDGENGSATINIWRGLRGKAAWVALLHELLHRAFTKRFGPNCPTMTIEETLIELLDEHLFEILNRNFGFGPQGLS